MYNIVQRRKLYYIISSIIIIPGLLAMIYGLATTGKPLKLSIDFTGGVYWEFKLAQAVPPADVRAVFTGFGLNDTAVTTLGGEDNHFQARIKSIEQATKEEIQAEIEQRFGTMDTLQYRLVGPSVGREVTRAAFIAVLFAAVAILAFIMFAFRNVPHPIRYGVCAITAMIHDILVTIGFVAIMGLFSNWEVDALFLTALLTVIGFSVQDTIVVFDRIRENNIRHRNENFETIANRSLLGDHWPIVDDPTQRNLHHGSHSAVRRRDDQAIYRRDANRPDQRYLLLDLQRRAVACDMGRLGDQTGATAQHHRDSLISQLRLAVRSSAG